MLIDDTHFSPISNGGWDEDHFLEFVVNNFRVTFLQHKHKKETCPSQDIWLFF